MLFDDDPGGVSTPDPMPPHVTADALLAACAHEAAGQAQALHRLDAALGRAVAMARNGMGDGAALIAALTADLQNADRLRQEAEGLARALNLLATVQMRDHRLTVDQVRGCTPFVALQRRLLAGQGAGPS
ncbi:MAG: hypothetical protein WCO04_16710 [Pseudomonadota bacterium]